MGSDKFYVNFKSNEQNKFLKEVKETSFYTWAEIYSLLSISKSMFFLYLSEQHRLPLSSFEKLLKISGISSLDYQYKVEFCSNHGKAYVSENNSQEIAEFVGIILGDGNVNPRNYQITISGGEVDGAYITNYIPFLITNLFSKEAIFKKQSIGGRDCIFYSKDVCNYLQEKFKITSPKADSTIPSEFFKNPSLLKACVRGLIDTDGGFHRHHKNSAQIHFTNKSKKLISSLRKALIQLGFKTSKLSYNHREKDTLQFYLFDENVKKYFTEIGSSNPKNNLKFKYWIGKGIMPLNREIFMI